MKFQLKSPFPIVGNKIFEHFVKLHYGLNLSQSASVAGEGCQIQEKQKYILNFVELQKKKKIVPPQAGGGYDRHYDMTKKET